jgi:hypothetical protein
METLIYHIENGGSTWQERTVDVSSPIKIMNIKINIPKEYALLCYIIVKDSNGKFRMFREIGYGPRTLIIGNDGMHTTAGGTAGDIPIGRWKFIICAFREYVMQRLGKNSFNVKVTISDDISSVKEPVGEQDWVGNKEFDIDKNYSDESRWYKGDFHTHTRLSDGKETTRSAMKKAEQMGMDFYIPTEHNVLHTGWPEAKVMVVPGVEITTSLGHFNIFGCLGMPGRLTHILKHDGEDRISQEVEYTIREADEKEWLWSINHPFLHIWKWTYFDLKLKNLRLMEIINDPTYEYAKKANEDAISFIDFLWQQGFRVFGLGGSDSHNLIDERYEGADEPGDPATLVYMDGMTPSKLLKAVSKGHVIVARYITMEVYFLFENKKYLPGDRIEITGDSEFENDIVASVTIKINEETYGKNIIPELYLIENGVKREVVLEKRDERTYMADVVTNWHTIDWEWKRFEVLSKDYGFLGYVNPIFHGRKKSKLKTFGEAVQLWRGQ